MSSKVLSNPKASISTPFKETKMNSDIRSSETQLKSSLRNFSTQRISDYDNTLSKNNNFRSHSVIVEEKSNKFKSNFAITMS